MYLFDLVPHLQATLSTLITSDASRFNGAHLLSICGRVFAALKLCYGDTAAERTAKHAPTFDVTETTHYVVKRLRDDTRCDTTPPKGRQSQGIRGLAESGADHRSRNLPELGGGERLLRRGPEQVHAPARLPRLDVGGR